MSLFAGLCLACCVTFDLACDVCMLHGHIVVGAGPDVADKDVFPLCCWLLDHY